MKNILIFFGVLVLATEISLAQSNQENIINDVLFPSFENNIKSSNLRSGNIDYRDFRTWIPYCNSEPLKNPPITYIEVSFHVFLDNNGQNNSYLNSPDGRNRLIQMLNTVNAIYAGGWAPSDPVSGVVELPNRDTRIRFTLGDNNERIYFYNNTTQNHEWNYSNFDSYILNNFPSRSTKLNIYLTAGYYQGKVESSNITITNGGTGYSSVPSVTFSPAGATASAVVSNGQITAINIVNKGSYNGFDPPQITISGGGGSGATAVVTKLSGGATGYIANRPSSSNFNTTHHVVMLRCHEATDWIFGMTLAHELGHDLELLHTYCGGGAGSICCSGSCAQGCTQDCSNSEYLSDIFGACPGTCPHDFGWYDPTLSGPKHTNNVMGGSSSSLYFSPMQAGQMHRVLALKSPRRYVKSGTYSDIPLIISASETWDFSLKLYRDVVVSSGAVLTINSPFILPYNGTITINNGAAIVIGGGIQLPDLNKIIVKSGGTIKLSSLSNIQVSGSGKIEVQSGGYFCIESGATINLNDFNSVINLKCGYINGVNPSVTGITSNCVASPGTYATTGSGKINAASFLTDVYIQNETLINNRYITGRNIYIGSNVTTTKAQGPVYLGNGANIIFNACGEIIEQKEFYAPPTSKFEFINH